MSKLVSVHKQMKLLHSPADLRPASVFLYPPLEYRKHSLPMM